MMKKTNPSQTKSKAGIHQLLYIPSITRTKKGRMTRKRYFLSVAMTRRYMPTFTDSQEVNKTKRSTTKNYN